MKEFGGMWLKASAAGFCALLVGGCVGPCQRPTASAPTCSMPCEPECIAPLDPANWCYGCQAYCVAPLDPVCHGYHPTSWTPWGTDCSQLGPSTVPDQSSSLEELPLPEHREKQDLSDPEQLPLPPPALQSPAPASSSRPEPTVPAHAPAAAHRAETGAPVASATESDAPLPPGYFLQSSGAAPAPASPQLLR